MFFSLWLNLVGFFSGCSSNSGPLRVLCNGKLDIPSNDLATALAEPIANNAVPLILAKNPDYRLVFESIADRIDGLFLEETEIDAARIKAFTAVIAKEFKMDAESEIAVGRGLLDPVNLDYRFHPRDRPILSSDPSVQEMLLSISDGFRDGIKFCDALPSVYQLGTETKQTPTIKRPRLRSTAVLPQFSTRAKLARA